MLLALSRLLRSAPNPNPIPNTNSNSTREFAAKYNGAWDEISVGSDWFNELTQHYLAKSNANAIPHVMVFRDSDGFDPAPERGHYLNQVAELLELTVVPASSQFRIELQEDGAASSIRCSEATLSHPRRLRFTAQEDDTTATAECALSLDGRRMRLAFKPHGWSEQTMTLDRVAE